MLLVNQQKIEADAFTNGNHPLHIYAKEYERGIKELRKRFPSGEITFIRVGYPKLTDGLTARGTEVRDIPEPTPPIRIPLRTVYAHPERGRELWACCLDAPKILPGNLWDLGQKRAIQMERSLTVNLTNDAELAFYLQFISNIVRGGHVKIDDPKAEIVAKANLERQDLEIRTAIWGTLQDETALRTISMAWGIADAGKKEPDALRFELQELLKINDDKQKRDPSIKGTREFLEEMKITDNVRLRAFIRNAIDNSLITYRPDGRYVTGDRVLVQVPQQESQKKFDYLCNFFAAPNNAEKLKELLIDIVNKEYLDGIQDEKDYRFLAKHMQLEGYFNKAADKIKEMVYRAFGF